MISSASPIAPWIADMSGNGTNKQMKDSAGDWNEWCLTAKPRTGRQHLSRDFRRLELEIGIQRS
jgi:hypothetical protein